MQYQVELTLRYAVDGGRAALMPYGQAYTFSYTIKGFEPKNRAEADAMRVRIENALNAPEKTKET